MWFDSHCHLNDEAFDVDVEDVVQAALDNGIGGMIVAGYDLKSSIRALELAVKYNEIWATAGIHPHDAKSWNSVALRELEDLLQESKMVAVGEIGLDYHYDYSEKQDQLTAFIEQIELAKDCNKPVIIHDREAHEDLMKVLVETGVGTAGGVLHCFTGSAEVASFCMKKGLFISFAGALTFRNANKLLTTAAGIPLDKVLVETDSPYLTPHPFRGQRNNPSLVKLVGQKLAELKKLSVEEIMRATSENCRSLFKI